MLPIRHTELGVNHSSQTIFVPPVPTEQGEVHGFWKFLKLLVTVLLISGHRLCVRERSMEPRQICHSVLTATSKWLHSCLIFQFKEGSDFFFFKLDFQYCLISTIWTLCRGLLKFKELTRAKYMHIPLAILCLN